MLAVAYNDKSSAVVFVTRGKWRGAGGKWPAASLKRCPEIVTSNPGCQEWEDPESGAYLM